MAVARQRNSVTPIKTSVRRNSGEDDDQKVGDFLIWKIDSSQKEGL